VKSALVAGVDSSTQACKVVIRDYETGALVRQGRAPHPDGTEIDPQHWWHALNSALESAGGLEQVEAISIAAQQHGMICLDESAKVVRPALLWNDVRSAQETDDLIAEFGEGKKGPTAWAQAVGTVPVPSLTITKLRWMARHEVSNAKATRAVCLPHDWLTWKLRAADLDINELTTDRGDASGTGYWSPSENNYRLDLLERAFGRSLLVPKVIPPKESPGHMPNGIILAPGTGDNAASSLGIGMNTGDAVVSIGTSGVIMAISDKPTADSSGEVAGFADATGHFLPLVCTLNAARIFDAVHTLLGIDRETLYKMALEAPAGADGLTLIPYFEGERTPNRPFATGSLYGMNLANSSPGCLARAAIEGVLCGLADGLDALTAQGVQVERVILAGGGSRSEAVRRIASQIFGRPVYAANDEGEHVADGAARQAAWVLSGEELPPAWDLHDYELYEDKPTLWVRERYAELRDLQFH